MPSYTDDGRKKPTFKTNPEMKRLLMQKGHKPIMGPIYKPNGITGPYNKGPGYYVQYDSHKGRWAFLGKSKDEAMKAIG